MVSVDELEKRVALYAVVSSAKAVLVDYPKDGEREECLLERRFQHGVFSSEEGAQNSLNKLISRGYENDGEFVVGARVVECRYGRPVRESPSCSSWRPESWEDGCLFMEFRIMYHYARLNEIEEEDGKCFWVPSRGERQEILRAL